jgi:hypothetical protein
MASSVFDKFRIVLLASEGCLNRDHVDLLLLNPASATGTYPGPPQVRIPRGRHLQGAANSLLATLYVFHILKKLLRIR